MTDDLKLETVFFTYTEDSGSLKKLKYDRGSVFHWYGHNFRVVDAQPLPRFLDYGQTPFQVRLRCRLI